MSEHIKGKNATEFTSTGIENERKRTTVTSTELMCISRENMFVRSSRCGEFKR
jgi:hypothetical protein